MQIAIDPVKVESFKNWFFGRTAQAEYIDDQPFFHIPIEVTTKSELPIDGHEERRYYVADTGDTYRFADGVYYLHDVYAYGVDEIYRDTPRTYVPKQTIVDHSWNIPAISAEQIQAGSSPVLATLHNIQALLTDLEQIRRIKVYGYKTTLMEVLGTGFLADKDQNVTNWFAKEHKLLYRLLISAYRTKSAFNKDIVDAMFKHNYVLTWDDRKNCPVLKVNDFIVYL